ncbi:MAG: HNH endonuclease [Lachnospiraceae bacterium]|nr:HNH endonuclease [Lachnospiraceae bacterium]
MCKKNLLAFGYEMPQEEELNIEDIPIEDIEDELLEKIAKQHSIEKPKLRESTVTQRDRDPYLAEYAKRRAKGICQLCENPAPFMNEKGVPYLESHHIVELSEGGEDSVENTVALCPNCHRKMHIVKDLRDVQKLKKKGSL